MGASLAALRSEGVRTLTETAVAVQARPDERSLIEDENVPGAVAFVHRTERLVDVVEGKAFRD